MKIQYRIIYLGEVLGVQKHEKDGPLEANEKEIQSDQYDGVDPLVRARAGMPTVWVEAKAL